MQLMLSKHLVISEIFPPIHGGSGKWLYEAYKRLPASRFLMVVGRGYELDYKGDATYPQTIIRMDLGMKNRNLCNYRSIFAYVRQFVQISKIIRTHSISQIHAARPLSEGFLGTMLSIRFRIPLVQFVHGEDINIATTSRELKILTNFVLKRATRIIANSHFTQSLLKKDWSEQLLSKTTIVHPGVDTGYFYGLPTHKNPYEQRFLILTAGRLQKRKGHDVMLRAVAGLKERHPKLYYIIVGDGEERKSLEHMISAMNLSDHVHLAGEVSEEELRNYYMWSDLFVLPNRTIGKDVEGFGMVLLEAQACSKPVIAGDSGGTAETLLDGKTGFVVDCTEPQALIAVIDKMIDLPEMRLSMGAAARNWVQSNFDWENSARHLAKVISVRN